jgi:glycosyltransferase involved in cell wall biosynthesis
MGDVFVSPTSAEGFSNTVLEAMASGLPVLSCRAVGVLDCIRDDENGLLVEPGDVPALAAALGRLVAEPALRTRLAEAALEECRRTYSWPAVAGQVMRIHEALRGRPPRAAVDPVLPRDETCRFLQAPHLL